MIRDNYNKILYSIDKMLALSGQKESVEKSNLCFLNKDLMSLAINNPSVDNINKKDRFETATKQNWDENYRNPIAEGNADRDGTIENIKTDEKF